MKPLPMPEGYDATTQHTISVLAAGLDDQLNRLRQAVRKLEVSHLEWQPAPGFNTIGMLLTHLAAVEVGWLKVGAQGLPWKGEGEELIRGILGVQDDGFPLPPDGKHPECLRGKTVGDYLAMLDQARRTAHEVLRGWTDQDLETTFQANGHELSRGWTLYHLLEHFAGHYGQLLLLKRHLRQAGLLPEEAKASA